MATTAVATALRIAEPAHGDSDLRAFIDYSDSLAKANGETRLALSAEDPPLTGSPAWDAALAAIVEYWLNDAGLAAPSWTELPSRFSPEPQSPQLGFYDLEPDVTNVPSEFLRRNILLERSTLQSV